MGKYFYTDLFAAETNGKPRKILNSMLLRVCKQGVKN